MKKRLEALFIAACVLAVVCIGVTVIRNFRQPSQVLGGSNGGPISNGGATRFTATPTNTGIACGTASTLVAATSTARNYLSMINDSANTIYLSEGVAAVGSTGIRLNSGGGSYEINALNLYTGAVYCIASSTSVLSIVSSQ